MKREIGKTGIFVFPVGLGAMPMSVVSDRNEGDAIRVLHTAWEAGIQFVDTANVYCLDEADIGHNERLISKALRQRPFAGVQIATKGGFKRPGKRWETDGSPDHLRLSCERSLKDLGVESIFLYQLHAPDSNTPFLESLGTLVELRREGKIQHIGISNVSTDQAVEALNMTRIETIQNRAHPFWKQDYKESRLLELCEQHTLTFLPYSTLGGYYDHRQVVNQEPLTRISKRRGVSPYQVIIAWHLATSPRIIPIPGGSKINSVLSSAGAVTVKLDPEEIKEINAFQDV